MITSTLNGFNLDRKRVLLRADLDMPVRNGEIKDDYRIRQILPTINYILDKGGTIILMGHIDRPQGPDSSLSTKHLIPWLEKHGYKAVFAPTIEDVHLKIRNGNRLILLENLRFFHGEQRRDYLFAQKLAALGDYYVNDAFGSMHRNDTSITIVPNCFPIERKTIGLSVQQELEKLQTIFRNPIGPFALIIGGAKAETKIPLISQLITKIDILLLCPAIVFNFLKAMGKPVGKSLINPEIADRCRDILKNAREHNVTVHFPIDYQIAVNTFEGSLSYVSTDAIPGNGVGISIGPKSTNMFIQEFKKAKTIVYNGLMGDIGRPETIESACNIFHAMGKVNAHTLIAGGDSVAAAGLCNARDAIEWCSTGGGAILAYLSGKKLPGLEALWTKN